jgi:hypothetical protein
MNAAGAYAVDRCAVHPSRRSLDRCPVCARPRCGADAVAYAQRGCPACVTAAAAPAPPGSAELVVRAALAALAAAFAGAWVAAQYVDTHYFGVVAPLLVGLACTWAAAAAATSAPRRTLLAVAVAAAVLATGLSDRLVPGGQNLFLPPGHRLPPYVAAVLGVVVWPVLFGPARPRNARG